jgi:predicted CoA-binding protein
MAELTTPAEVTEVLRSARTIAVLGAHHDEARPAFYVPDYLFAQGYRVFPVNPALVGKILWGEPVRASLAEIGEQIDIVDVFRRPELLQGHLDDLLAMKPKPKLVWLQLGIRDDAFARAVQAAQIDVVQDRCALADHRAFGVGPVAKR